MTSHSPEVMQMARGVEATTATVYYGGGRRWFTLRAASLSEANRTIRRRLEASGDGPQPDEWYRPRRDRLAGMYRARFRRLSHLPPVAAEKADG